MNNDRRTNRKPRLLVLLCILWLSGVAGGMAVLYDYSNQPGPSSGAPLRWPQASSIDRHPGRATLLIFAHPRCPCTRATIGELAVAMRHVQGQVSGHVLFSKPEPLPNDWEKTDLWRSAAAIPGVQVLTDLDGTEARRFRAATSGAALLYDADGKLIFNGGITESRGHHGDNAGRSAVVALLTQGIPDRDKTFVFGCELFD